MDPVSLIVTALVSGLSAGLGESASAAMKDAYGILRDRLQRTFNADPVARATLDAHATSPDTWDRLLREQISRLGADRDGDVLEAAQRVLTIADARGSRSGSHHIHVGGHGRAAVGDRGDVQLHGASAGRDITTKIDKSRRRTTIALGGVALAIVVLFVWFQYSAKQESADALSAYQRGVLATCERIRNTSTSQFNPQLEGQQPVVLRSDVVAAVKRDGRIRHEQVSDLLRQPHPDALDTEWAAVGKAERTVVKAQPALLDELRGWPEKIEINRLAALSDGPAATEFTDSRRRLGDSLTRLAGETCAIERS